MCWIETLRNVKYQVADKDIKVYKIVKCADKQSCVSIIQNFNYAANTLYKVSTLEYAAVNRRPEVIKIEKAYHSYTGIQFVCDSVFTARNYAFNMDNRIHRYKHILFGNIKTYIPFESYYYIATFIIPKGATYIINRCGEIVSDKIIYTGKYLKL